MPKFSRRSSLILLMLSLSLFFAPALFSPPLGAQDSLAGEAKSIVPAVIQWGVGGAMFVVWLYQFRKSQTSDAAVIKVFTDHLAESNKIMATAFEKYDKHVEMQVQLLRDAQAKNELLAGTLSRLEAKLDR